MKSFVSAVGLLTIIPVPYKWAKNISGASVYFSLTGFLIGLIYFMAGSAVSYMNIKEGWGGFIILFSQVILTRAFHIDGLADMVDGFWGGKDKYRRLEIMKDSSIGVFGTVSVVLLLLGKWIAIANLFEKKILFVLVASSTISRLAMTISSGFFSYSRKEGTGNDVITNTGIIQVVISIIYTGIILTLYSGAGALLLILSGIIISFLVGYLSSVKIGGITGDVLGASCEIVDFFVIIISIYIADNYSMLLHPFHFAS